MKVIFLDIDGVLVTYKEIHSRSRDIVNGMHIFNKACVDRLNKLVEDSGAELVLSSSWRVFGLEAFNEHASNQGILKLPIDITPSLDSKTESGIYIAKQRGHEIKAWLDKYPDVTHYAILDDNTDMDTVRDNFVFVKDGMSTGLQDHHVEKVLKLLED